jgi:exosortase/archaeosortase family protein
MSARSRKTSRARARRAASQRAAWWFPVRFLAIWLVAILALSMGPGLESWAIRGTVEGVRLALLALGRHADVSDDILRLGAVQFQIVSDCTPLMPTMLYWAGCLAFPAPWRWKTLGIVIGAAALWIFNLARVVALFGVKSRWPEAFDFIHIYVWQSGTLLVVFLLFLGWIGARDRWERLMLAARSHAPAAETSTSATGT